MAIGRRNLQGLWLKALLFALFGYALLGKGFAYLFVGEMILVVGFVIFLRSQRIMLVFSDSVLLLWGVFACWGFCRTVPFLQRYGFDAMRDAVVWGYGICALFIVAFVNSSKQISLALNSYRKFLRWYLPILPVLVMSVSFRDKLPVLPWGDNIAIIMLRSGEASVHLAAAALFMLIFPVHRNKSAGQGMSINRLLAIVGWFSSALIILITCRAGAAAIMIAIILASVLETRKIGWKVAIFSIAVILSSLMALELNPFDIYVKNTHVTPDSVNNAIGSVFSTGDAAEGHKGTKEFRLVWWKHIVDYTIFGPYRWTGKGFGVNLAVEDGPPGMTEEESALRSPHNGSMTVLARMGVPGLAIWVALNFVFVFRLLKAYRLARRSGSRFWSGVNLWIFCYWLAAFINMSFDVYLEGPEGGIWFWTIIGLGVAVLRVQAHEARQLVIQSRMQPAEIPDAEDFVKA